MKKPYVNVNLDLTDAAIKQLEELAERSNMSVNEFCNEILLDKICLLSSVGIEEMPQSALNEQGEIKPSYIYNAGVKVGRIVPYEE